MKKVLALVHGFMIHDRHDFKAFKKYFDQQDLAEEYEVVLFTLYDRLDSKSCNHKNMFKSLCQQIEAYGPDREVILLGYSFSCSMVAKASLLYSNIKRVILVAPTNSLFKTKLIFTYIKLAFKSIQIKLKYGKKKAETIMNKTKLTGVFTIAFNVAKSIVINRKYFKKVNKPLLYLRGTKDLMSLQSTYKEIHSHLKTNYCRVEVFEDYDHHFVRFEESITKSFYPACKNFLLDTERSK